MRITNLKLNIFGFSAHMYNYKSRKSYIKVITYLAGPLFNLLCAIIFIYINCNIELKYSFVYTNIILFVLNLLPIMPLDGGRIIKEIIKYFFGNKKASIIMINVSKICLIILSGFYAIAILKIKNIAILLLIIYLWYLYIIEERKVNTLKRAYEIMEKI